jgi:hypothetical protein
VKHERLSLKNSFTTLPPVLKLKHLAGMSSVHPAIIIPMPGTIFNALNERLI